SSARLIRTKASAPRHPSLSSCQRNTHRNCRATASRKETVMMLATTRVQDFDRWMKIFSTTSADKRKQHGSKGAVVFRDPTETDRVWVLFDWTEQGWQDFVADPTVAPILREAGHKEKPQIAALAGQLGA